MCCQPDSDDLPFLSVLFLLFYSRCVNSIALRYKIPGTAKKFCTSFSMNWAEMHRDARTDKGKASDQEYKHF